MKLNNTFLYLRYTMQKVKKTNVIVFSDLMKAASQDNAASSNGEVKTAEVVILLDGLRVHTSVLNQAHEVVGGESSRTALSEGIRARLRMRNNETLRTVVRAPNLRVSFSNNYYLTSTKPHQIFTC